MLHPNSYTLAKATHEQRVTEALDRYHYRSLGEPQVGLLHNLGQRLVALGTKFTTDNVATSPAEPAVG